MVRQIERKGEKELDRTRKGRENEREQENTMTMRNNQRERVRMRENKWLKKIEDDINKREKE